MKLAKKSLGQNFLIDNNIKRKIINLVNIKDKNIIEIGPGKGALTEEILKQNPKSLYVIEKDNKLFDEIKQRFFNNKKIKIYNADILKFKIEKIIKKNTIIFGNLPFNISSQILIKILKFEEWPPKFNDLILMFQKELGEKITANFPSKNYGRLSIITNYRLNIVKKFLVSASCFIPKPKVTSVVIHFKPKVNSTIEINNINNLEKITNILFSNKRKMINKNIKKIINSDVIKKINLDLNFRPAEIKPELYYKITKMYEKK